MSFRFLSRFAKGLVGGTFACLPGKSGVFARRWLVWELLRGQALTLEFEREGFRWTVFTNDIVGRGLFLRGEFQIEGLDALLNWCASNVAGWEGRTTVINVGANIGATCLPLARHAKRRCIAIEPVPQTFELLSCNVRQNRVGEQIHCLQAAVAAEAGTIEMLAPRDSGHSEVKSATGRQGFSGHYSSGDCATVRVPAIPLDQVVASENLTPEQIALVWSDTQGFESEVIASGGSLWKSGVPLWVEVWPEGLEAHGGVERFLQLANEHFRHLILDDDFQSSPPKLRPVTELAEIIRGLQTRGGSGGRVDHDVLLVP